MRSPLVVYPLLTTCLFAGCNRDRSLEPDPAIDGGSLLGGDGRADLSRASAPRCTPGTLAFQDGARADTDWSSAIRAGDVDGDGRPDVVVLEYASGKNQPSHPTRLALLRGLGGGQLAAPARTDIPGASGFGVPLEVDLAIGDLDGDGVGDVVAAPNYQSISYLLRGHRGGALGAIETLQGGAYGLCAGRLGAGPADALAVALPDLALMLPSTLGAFTPLIHRGSQWAATSFWTCAIGDLDGNGLGDLIAARFSDAHGHTQGIAILHGHGDGTFDDGALVADTGMNPQIADVDGDGFPDIVALETDGVRTWRNDGKGDFRASQKLVRGTGIGLAAVGDLDCDGRADVLVMDSAGTTVWLGQRDGSFAPSGISLLMNGDAAIADLDGDGRLDVVGLTPVSGFGTPKGTLVALNRTVTH